MLETSARKRRCCLPSLGHQGLVAHRPGNLWILSWLTVVGTCLTFEGALLWVEYYIELANFAARAGFDFYPNYGRYVIQSLLQGIEENGATTIEGYGPKLQL
jgi:hypothetical protein